MLIFARSFMLSPPRAHGSSDFSILSGSRSRKHFAHSRVSLATMALLAHASSVQAQAVIDGGNTVNVPSGAQPSPWTIPGTGVLTVGNTGNGTLNIEAGSSVSSKNSYVGQASGSSGVVTVSGPGSIWTTAGGTVNIGTNGTGKITIKDGATLQNATGGYYLGFNPGSSGTLTVSGQGSNWINTSFAAVYVGWKGEGTLNVLDGGVITNQQSYVGHSAGAVNTATVSGAGSRWNSELIVGHETGSTGIVNIEGGGVVSGKVGSIGWYAGSSGTVNVSGTDADGNPSSWITDSLDHIGKSGAGTLNISNGGRVSTASIYGNATIIGTSPGASGVVNVSNGSLTTAASLRVGDAGAGLLNIGAGGTVSNTDGHIGYSAYKSPASLSGQVLVSGAGASWTNSSSLTIGHAGVGTLTIADGGKVTSPTVSMSVTSTGVGTLNIGAPQGNAPAAPGTLTASTLTMGAKGSLVFNHTNTSGAYRFDPKITGAGSVTHTAGVTALTANNIYSGVTTISGGTLAAGAANALSPNSTHVLQAGGALDLRGFDQKVPALSNAGSVIMGEGPGIGRTLTVAGSYTSNGGSLYMNSVLNGDSSATDRLVASRVVMGNGATRLHVTNQGGLGALTTGNGIKLVQVNTPGASAEDAFALGGRVAAGAYEYTLAQNGLNADAGDGNWYLRSTRAVIPPPPPPPPLQPEQPEQPDRPEQPARPPISPERPLVVQLPNYRNEVPVAMAVPALTKRYGLATLGTYHERTGGGVNRSGSDGKARAWARAIGESGEVGGGIRGAGNNQNALSRHRRFADHGPSYDYDIGAIQVGADLYRKTGENGVSDTAGLYVGAGRTDATVGAVYGGRAGKASMNGYSMGGYWTREAASGAYLDAVAQATRYDRVRAEATTGNGFKSSGHGLAASLEAGYPLALQDAGKQGWMLEPQAQVILQNVNLRDSADDYGQVQFRTTNTVTTRAGLRLSKDWSRASGRGLTTWARANLWNTSGADAKTTFSTLSGTDPITLNTRLAGTSGQLGVGVAGEVAKKVTLFGSVDYNRALDSGTASSVSGRAGIRVLW